MRKVICGPYVVLRDVARAEREWAAALRREESADSVEDAWRFAAASDRCARKLAALRDGVILGPVALSRRMRARIAALSAFEALATIGRVIARSVQASNALAAARRKLAARIRPAFNRVRKLLSGVVALFCAPSKACSTCEGEMPFNTRSAVCGACELRSACAAVDLHERIQSTMRSIEASRRPACCPVHFTTPYDACPCAKAGKP